MQDFATIHWKVLGSLKICWLTVGKSSENGAKKRRDPFHPGNCHELMLSWKVNIGLLSMRVTMSHIWLVVWNMFYFPYIGNNHPNWLIFFRRGSNHQPDILFDTIKYIERLFALRPIHWCLGCVCALPWSRILLGAVSPFHQFSFPCSPTDFEGHVYIQNPWFAEDYFLFFQWESYLGNL